MKKWFTIKDRELADEWWNQGINLCTGMLVRDRLLDMHMTKSVNTNYFNYETENFISQRNGDSEG